MQVRSSEALLIVYVFSVGLFAVTQVEGLCASEPLLERTCIVYSNSKLLKSTHSICTEA